MFLAPKSGREMRQMIRNLAAEGEEQTGSNLMLV